MERTMKRLFLLALIVILHFYVNAQTPQQVYNYCDSIGIKHPDIVTKQSIKETGRYTCTECSYDHNNLFGFRYKKQYLQFDTWEQSCDYYLKFQTKYYQGQDYYDFLDCIWKHRDGRCARFATDENYTNDLKETKWE